MAVFVSASDENSGKDQSGGFMLGGWVAPEEDWSRYFAPAWQQRVLDGPPSIPYLHMTDIRSPKWRAKYGLSKLQASDRTDEAIAVIDAMGALYPLSITIDGGHFHDKFKEQKLIAASGGIKKYEPDYFCFVAYSYAVLKYLDIRHPEAEKVDFIVERNGEITKHIQEFHSHLAASVRNLGEPLLERLVGELIPAGKERIPTQAADILCWHAARTQHPETMDEDDIRRWTKLSIRKGKNIPISNQTLEEISKAFAEYIPTG